MARIKTLTVLLLFFSFTLSKSEANPSRLLPLPLESLTSRYNQDGGNCSYRVVITTSCSSPSVTTDEISIAFGDSMGNMVYVSRLDDPISGTFSRCSTDGFNVNGTCAYQICSVNFYRSGNIGWQPANVTISGDNSMPVTFSFDSPVPNNVWYGQNKCELPPSSPPPPSTPFPFLSPPPPTPSPLPPLNPPPSPPPPTPRNPPPSPPPPTPRNPPPSPPPPTPHNPPPSPPPPHPIPPPPPSPTPPPPTPPSSSIRIAAQAWLMSVTLVIALFFML